MPTIEVTTKAKEPADTRVVPFFEGDELEGAAAALAESGEAKPKLKSVAVTHDDGTRVLVAGMGKRDELDGEKARVAASAVAGRAKEVGAKSLSWDAPDGFAGPIVEGTLLTLYEFKEFKSSGDDDDDDENGLTTLEMAGADDDEVKAAAAGANAANAARDLQNLPSNVATPTFLAERAEDIAKAHDALSLEVLGRKEIEAAKMGAFVAVAKGSDAEPKLIVLRYDGGGSGPHLGYVGKAVTFDTGGISLKPGAKMSEMKFDMSGGAAVLEAMGAIAELAIPVKITAVVPATENMPSGHAVKPGDIVTAANGKTIEINNTDAEGRLILADALNYAIEDGAERVVNLATLTGAIIVALGSTHAGLFSNDDDWCAEVDAASTDTGELGWRLPLHPEYEEIVKGKYADLDNAPEGRKASSITAAEFLKAFVGDTPWVHVDIAGTAWGLGRPYVGSGASGFGVRMLIELARRTAS